jgi:chitodextrinase
MTEFAIERFTYTWKGEWEPEGNYKRDDVVFLNGKSYVCIETHTASTIFSDDLNAVIPDSDPPQLKPKWVLMTSGLLFRGDWETETEYNIYELVYYKGTVYKCINNHVSTEFYNDESNWSFFARHIEYIGDWEPETPYSYGAVVKYNGIIYECVAPHLSSNSLKDDINNWKVFYNGIEYRGAWEPSSTYRKNDLVKFGGSIYRCTEEHTSVSTGSAVGFDKNKFEIEIPGFQYESVWNSSTEYQVGDVVKYGGVLYYANTSNINIDPTQPEGNDTWSFFSDSYNFRGKWSVSESYKTGDIVQRGGQVFLAKQDINIDEIDSSNQDYLDPDWWELLIPGSVFQKSWQEDVTYSVGDVVYYRGSAYRCNFEHVSATDNFPGDNGNIYDYWDLFIQGSPAGLQAKGDLLTFGLTRDEIGDDSSLGLTNVSIGNENDVLSVSSSLEAFWRTVEFDSDTIFVSTQGFDERNDGINRGLTATAPFRTIRFACEYIEDNFEAGTLVTVRVATGTYEEIGPIIVPAGCAIVGDELRSTTVSVNPPNPNLEGDFERIVSALGYLQSIILNIVSNQEIEPTPGNNSEQLLNTTTTDINGVNNILNQLEVFLDQARFRLGLRNNPVEISGSNDLSTDQAKIDAGTALFENRIFIANELAAYIEQTFDFFDRDRYVNDFEAVARGIRRDFIFSGNYGTILSANRYANQITGSQTDDLFRMRDTTGLRSCTLRGLKGDLIEPVNDRIYPDITGGAYVALDPGWGPADERTWINNRSPYIQGVTTIGDKCYGKHINGSLHNGGNRSMVSNDFTQVLSDGVGILAENNARTELVSVFTYYCAVGYLADTGGKIRATNGNNSYGRFGTVANGIDPNETPLQATVNTRNNEAQVIDGFAGSVNNEILAFEYGITGNNYSQAAADIEGAGDFAEVEFSDFRDGAMFDVEILPFQDSGSIGGSGYTTRQGFAQETVNAEERIIISRADVNQIPEDYIGLRIIIIAGPAAGQYGIIDAYNPPTKEAAIIKESTGDPGWDHIVSGTPILNTIESTNRYRIEPLISVEEPEFLQSFSNLPLDRTYIDTAFDYITQFFENIDIGDGTLEDDAVPKNPAVFDIVQRGEEYEVTLVDGGSGYNVGDSFTISGDRVGGISPENDLYIDVTEVSADSTNSVINFSSEGKARGKRFVSIANPNFAIYSDNGEDFLENNLPFAGNYVSMASGNNRFVAVASSESRAAFSYNGIDWSEVNLPLDLNWSSVSYGTGVFVIVADDSDTVLYSSNGEQWQSTEIPPDTVGDSTVSSYSFVEFGKGKFVALSSNDRATATSTDGINWSRNDLALPNVNSTSIYDFAGFTYGDNKFVALSKEGFCIYSFDGVTWYEGTIAPNTSLVEYVDIKYYQGIFLAAGKPSTGTPTSELFATTYDCLTWESRTGNFSQEWTTIGFSNLNNRPEFYLFADSTRTNGLAKINAGKPAKLRPELNQGAISDIKIWDPGSGYDPDNLPVITVFDDTAPVEAFLVPRIGNGSLSQPDFVNRGSGYVTTSSTVTISGNGYGNVVPVGDVLTLSGLPKVPDVGVQIIIDGVFDSINEDQLELFTAARVRDLGDDGTRQGTKLIEFDVNPSLDAIDQIQHGTSVTLRENYSQARVTNHDYLDIGTGSFEQTNYPDIYAGGNFFRASPENEVFERNGGRVFYVSTDQDGNFRGGELFAVNQATGVITISAEFFDLQGLSELALGGIRLGGSGTVVREFSTDPNFTADSDNIIPTQKAIAEFLQIRLSVGGENLETNLLTAGRIQLGGPENNAFNLTGRPIEVRSPVIINGLDRSGSPTSISGTIISQQLFLRETTENMQQ